jgi:hypothetical protein
MSVLTPKRLIPAVAVLLFASAAFAAHPSPRTYARMAYDAKNKVSVMFGGESAFDPGTSHAYDSRETWLWSGATWTQVFPANSPQERTAHGMVYDSLRQRVVLFGGRHAKTTSDGDISLFNDTWMWNGSNWSQINTQHAPDPRQMFAMTYDRVRDRVILFGGTHRTADGKSFEAEYDTWEFNGTDWQQVADNTGPKLNFPQIAYDVARNQVILIGADSTSTTLTTKMFIYDPATKAWNAPNPAPDKLPDCANDAAIAYRNSNDHIVLVGGVCSTTTSGIDQTWEWNGTTWKELTDVASPGRATAQAVAYDQLRDAVVYFGGFNAFDATPRSSTNLYQAGTYKFPQDITRPSPRSLASFRTNPNTNIAYLFGGLSEFGSFYLDDFDPSNTAQRRFWAYKNGFWFPLGFANAPTECTAPLSAYDTQRSKLVVFCSGSSETFEFDGTAWSAPAPKHAPPARRLAAMVYDENLKKTVLFGGFDETNYRQDTWTWEGTDWTEVKKNRPPNRSSMAMWYDPLAHKTIFYSGLGRGSIDERITRYSDMYSFDGNGWTKLNVTTTPGERFGAQIAIDPRSGKLLLFGGFRSVLDSSSNARTQFYDNDTWIWDGAANSWTQVNPAVSPSARQNGAMAFDPIRKEIVLFGGYAGFYFSDTWVWNGTSWAPRMDAPLRARSAPAHEPAGTGPTLIDDPAADH